MGQTDSPWQGKTLAELGHDDPHDPATCQVCAPARTAAYALGQAQAQERREFL